MKQERAITPDTVWIKNYCIKLGALSFVHLPLIVTFLILATLNSAALRGALWPRDLWHHVTLVKALMTNLFPKVDPFLDGVRPLIPYWPYEAMVALFSKISGLGAMQGLRAFSYINLAIILFGIERFSLCVSRSRLFMPVLVILMLGCWGLTPPGYSTFLHAENLFQVLSYPSTFAIGIALIGISRILTKTTVSPVASSIDQMDWLLATLIVLTHPVAALFYYVMTISIIACRGELRCLRGWINFLAALLIPLVAWSLWQPFPLTIALSQRFLLVDPDAVEMYDALKSTLGLAFPVLLMLVLRNTRTKAAYIELAIVLLVAIYAYGFYSQIWNLGRAISFVMFLLQVALAREIFDDNLDTPNYAFLRKGIAVFLLFISLFQVEAKFEKVFQSGCNAAECSRELIPRLLSDRPPIPLRGIVIADAEVSRFLPMLGYRALVFNEKSLFREEYVARRRAQQQFFEPNAEDSVRYQVIRDFGVEAVLIDTLDPLQRAIKQKLEREGKVERRDFGSGFEMLYIKPDSFLTQFRFDEKPFQK